MLRRLRDHRCDRICLKNAKSRKPMMRVPESGNHPWHCDREQDDQQLSISLKPPGDNATAARAI
jgi:hypothetical protein